ncbi:DegT/DnrJ/EryC1/StrS family aminotransferase [Bradyrhizobium archetypum]|uniref:DegT/DnrJ/EryC1/StrS family aminotransferase n=1 Tax=Bradyrhizobium archetypum TaxID=2721160 RepID=A0A7Y4HB40_9BRAD|nr:DegT/DnrJ/EryC1/StrS family aminotransferase [Bradyrhizobium archetypum]NOJ50964.1 DegT/DnrJ/EryC1/StrS family aminotransferase [Bradyrhizobium archetypum]
MKIGINDLQRHTRNLEFNLRHAIERVLRSGRYVLGGECSSFEQEFAAYCEAAHCVALASGTDALELSLRALGIGDGMRVATVANAGSFSAVTIRAVRAVPVFVEVDPGSHLMKIEDLEALLQEDRIDAVIITHLFGFMHDMQAIRGLTERAGVPLLEDCAQAPGARRDGRRAGSVGDAAAFSFYPTKNLGALGDGGAIISNNLQLADRLRLLRQYGWDRKYSIACLGGRNSRLDEMQAAVLRAKLPHLDRWNTRRREIAARYANGIRNCRVTCPPQRGEEYVAHLFVVTCDDPDGLRRYLASHQIATDVHYPIPDHLQPAVSQNNSISLPVTERLAKRILTLPCFPELSDEEVDYIIGAINAW